MKIAFFDTEVKKNPHNVGWDNYKALGVSVGCILEKEFKNNEVVDTKEYTFVDLPCKLVEKLNTFDLVVGFNNDTFDNNLLCEFSGGDQEFLINSFDIMKYLDNTTGLKHCTSLESIAGYTINESKTEGMDGSKAPELWQKYEQNNNEKALKKLKGYCMDDCKLTAKIFIFGIKYGYVLIRPNINEELFGNLVLKIPVSWKNKIKEV